MTHKRRKADLELRLRAEEQVEASSDQSELARVLYELNVHQLELEMQNDQLRLTQQELETSRERYFDLYNMAPVGYCTINQQHVILEANLTLATQLGVARGVLVKQPISRFISLQHRDGYSRDCHRLFASGTPMVCELRLQPVAAAPFWARLEGNLAHEDGDIPLCRLAISDISERKRLEAEVAKTAKLKSLGILAGGMAHDFNNLLQGIFGNIEIARMTTEESSRAYPFLEKATQQFHIANKLTAQLISFSQRGISNPINIEPANHIKMQVSSSLLGSGLVPEFDLADNLWLINIDPFQFHEVLRMIVVNAKEAMAPGSEGRITIKASNEPLLETNEKLPALPLGNYVRISIQDQGRGINEKDLSHIFDPYFSTKKRCVEKGTGLALALCEAIISKHGGAITVESQPGKDTTFDIYLPAITPAPQ